MCFLFSEAESKTVDVLLVADNAAHPCGTWQFVSLNNPTINPWLWKTSVLISVPAMLMFDQSDSAMLPLPSNFPLTHLFSWEWVHHFNLLVPPTQCQIMYCAAPTVTLQPWVQSVYLASFWPPGFCLDFDFFLVWLRSPPVDAVCVCQPACF